MDSYLKFTAMVLLITAFCQQLHGSKTAELKNQDWFDGIETWEPPAEMSKDLPYYQAGYDYDGRPVLVIEFGKWNSWKYTDDKAFRLYEMYAEKTWWRITQLKACDPEAEEGVTVIVDMSGFDSRQLVSPKLFGFLIKFAIKSAIAEPHIYEMLVVNCSFAATAAFNIFRASAGRLAGRAEMYGTKKHVWKAMLRSKIPADQLPVWYGGKNSFKPVQIFG